MLVPVAVAYAVAACSAAVLVLAHRPVVVRALPVVIRVAARTVWLQRRGGPRNRLRVACVAGRTHWIGAMVPRVVWRAVPKDKWRPGIDAMANIALEARDEVAARLSSSLCTVMATRTGSGYIAVIEICRGPGAGRMAGVALGRRLDMIL